MSLEETAGVEPDDFFFTTDLRATGAQTASRCAGRAPGLPDPGTNTKPPQASLTHSRHSDASYGPSE